MKHTAVLTITAPSRIRRTLWTLTTAQLVLVAVILLMGQHHDGLFYTTEDSDLHYCDQQKDASLQTDCSSLSLSLWESMRSERSSARTTTRRRWPIARSGMMMVTAIKPLKPTMVCTALTPRRIAIVFHYAIDKGRDCRCCNLICRQRVSHRMTSYRIFSHSSFPTSPPPSPFPHLTPPLFSPLDRCQPYHHPKEHHS